MTRTLFAFLLALSSLTCSAQQQEPQSLQVVRLNAGIHNIQAQVAQSEQEREIGLMFRRTMGGNAGMLFVFEDANRQCFWMKNTLLALSAAFIADDGVVVNVVDMQPQTLDSHCSARPVRYVLEMHQGWFAKRGIKPGTKLGGGPFSP